MILLVTFANQQNIPAEERVRVRMYIMQVKISFGTIATFRVHALCWCEFNLSTHTCYETLYAVVFRISNEFLREKANIFQEIVSYMMYIFHVQIWINGTWKVKSQMFCMWNKIFTFFERCSKTLETKNRIKSPSLKVMIFDASHHPPYRLTYTSNANSRNLSLFQKSHKQNSDSTSHYAECWLC